MNPSDPPSVGGGAASSRFQPSADDLSLEAGIRAAYEAVKKASTPEAQRQAFRLLAELAANRSEAMVEWARTRNS